MTGDRSGPDNEQPTGSNSAANNELAMTLSQVIASSMDKLGERLAETFSQGYDEWENYEEEFVEETEEPPHKRPRESGAFGVLQNLLSSTVPNQESSTAPNQEPPSAPSQAGSQPDYDVGKDQSDVIGEAVLQSLKQNMNSEGVGSPVHAEIATLIDTLFTSGWPEDNLKEKLSAYIRPANITKLVPVKVNSIIWDNLTPPARSTDLKMQKVHSGMIKALTAATQAASELKNSGQLTKVLGSVLEKIFDSIIFMSVATKDLNLRRRELLKPAINQEYSHLCSANVPVTDELFGPDLSQQIKDLSELNKVAKQLKVTRGRGGSTGRFPSRRGHFLGRGAFSRGASFNRGHSRGHSRGSRGPRRGNFQRSQNKST